MDVISLSENFVDSRDDQQLQSSKLYSKGKFFSDFIGQKESVDCLITYCAAAKLRRCPLEHTIIIGHAGLGKHTLSTHIANELGVNLSIRQANSILSPGDLVSLLTALNEEEIVLLEEIQELNPDCFEILYLAMDKFAIDLVIGRGPSANKIHLDLPHFTCLATTSQLNAVPEQLMALFDIKIHLRPYTISELSLLIEHYAKLWDLTIDDKSAVLIASACNGFPMDAIKLLKRMRDFAQVHNNNIIDVSLIENVLPTIASVKS